MSIKFSDIFGAAELNINNPKLEEMLNKTKNVAETVGKKNAEHWQYSRKKLECLDLKAKLSRHYERFGRLQYEAFIGGDPNHIDIEETANAIAAVREKLAILNEELEKARESFRGETESGAPDKQSDPVNKPEQEK